MIKYQGKEFKEKRELYDFLVESKDDLIEMKRASKSISDATTLNNFAQKTVKALNTQFEDDIDSGVIKRSLIANTYNWMDSHDDVHLNGVFSKSIKERGDKIFHLHDHQHMMAAKVGEPTKVYEKEVDWVDLGINKQGKTQVLMMDSEIMKDYNAMMFKQYLTGKVDQHSVGMIYVKIDLAINDPEYKEEFNVWEKNYSKLGNPERADKRGFFWAIKEAKLIENSAVLEGSNSITPTVQNEPPTKGTQTASDKSADDSHSITDKDEAKDILKDMY